MRSLPFVLVFALTSTACKGDNKQREVPAPPAAAGQAASPEPSADPPAKPSEGAPGEGTTADQRRCLELVGDELGLTTREVYEGKKLAPIDGMQATETVTAELVTLRGEPPAAVCVAARRIATRECEEADPECEGGSAWEEKHVVAALDPTRSAITDERAFSGSFAELEATDALRWSVEPIGPDADALVLTRNDASGAGDFDDVTWVTVAGGKLVPQLGYGTGIRDGMLVAKVEREPGKEVVRGRYELVFSVSLFDEDHQDEDAVEPVEVRCQWTARGAYDCDDKAVLARTRAGE